MITKSFENCMAMMLVASADAYGAIPIRDVNGKVYYATGKFTFPSTVVQTAVTSWTAAGISVGSGDKAESEMDYALEHPIESGISMTTPTRTAGADEESRPYVEYRTTVTNTGNSTIEIKEICYKQTLQGTTKPGGTSSTSCVCMLDRTLLDVPLILPAGDAGVIVYRITTSPYESKTVHGVKIVSFTWGTDAEIAAMIDAAQAGTINLQTDGGWQVGDIRTISVDAFTTGEKSVPQQNISIAISAFGDYNNSGSVMQFDFVESLSVTFPMNSTNTNTGGYDSTLMFQNTLPALAAALPNWLKSRMKTFDVLAAAGSDSATIETVSGNKLSLRSEIEIFGVTQYSKAGEGSQVEYYKATANRIKTIGYSGSTKNWWLRSPYSTDIFCGVSTAGSASTGYASGSVGVAPFGCI